MKVKAWKGAELHEPAHYASGDYGIAKPTVQVGAKR